MNCGPLLRLFVVCSFHFCFAKDKFAKELVIPPLFVLLKFPQVFYVQLFSLATQKAFSTENSCILPLAEIRGREPCLICGVAAEVSWLAKAVDNGVRRNRRPAKPHGIYFFAGAFDNLKRQLEIYILTSHYSILRNYG